MKKQYIKPTVNVMNLKYEAALCMGSAETTTEGAHEEQGDSEYGV